MSFDIHSARARVVKTKVHVRLLNKVLLEDKKVYKDMGSDPQLMRVEAEKNMTEEQDRAHRRETKQKECEQDRTL